MYLFLSGMGPPVNLQPVWSPGLIAEPRQEPGTIIVGTIDRRRRHVPQEMGFLYLEWKPN
jgi:hypothetical protein